MVYNPNAGYPPDWIDLKHLQSGLNKKLAGRELDAEKASTGGCFRGRDVGSWGWLMGMLIWSLLPRSRLKEIGDWIGVTDAGWVVCAAEVLLGIGTNGCGNLHGQHLWVSPSWDECLKRGYRIHICAYPQGEIEKMIDAIEICARPSGNCHVSLTIHPLAHLMKPPGAPPTPPTPPTPKKTYMDISSSPSSASIWLKKH